MLPGRQAVGVVSLAALIGCLLATPAFQPAQASSSRATTRRITLYLTGPGALFAGWPLSQHAATTRRAAASHADRARPECGRAGPLVRSAVRADDISCASSARRYAASLRVVSGCMAWLLPCRTRHAR
jgi:hypothetical protein